MDILSAAERLASIDRSAVAFIPERCLHSKFSASACQKCYEVCPVSAIQPGKPPSFNSEACQTCLACLPVCPVGAFQADDAYQDLLICATRLEVKDIEVLCELHPQPELGLSSAPQAARVHGCLAGLGSAVYLAMAAMGIERAILRCDACTDCPWGLLESTIEANFTSAHAILENWGLGETIQLIHSAEGLFPHPRPLWQAENPPLSRRDLFRLAAQRGQVAAARALAAGSQDRSAAHPGRERRRTNEALQKLLEKTVAPENLPMGDYGYVNLSVSEACSACGVCARVCPTGALTFQENGSESFLLNLTPQECVGCELCAHLCSQQAISIDHQPDFAQIFNASGPQILRQGNLIPCDRCNTPFAADLGGKYCPTCDYRIQHPFGVRVPPGFDDLQKLIEQRMRDTEEK